MRLSNAVLQCGAAMLFSNASAATALLCSLPPTESSMVMCLCLRRLEDADSTVSRDEICMCIVVHQSKIDLGNEHMAYSLQHMSPV